MSKEDDIRLAVEELEQYAKMICEDHGLVSVDQLFNPVNALIDVAGIRGFKDADYKRLREHSSYQHLLNSKTEIE
jgi:hypothetical protein